MRRKDMMENFLTIETSDGPMSAFVCCEEGEQKRPVVIILQEAFGVNHHIKDICERFAREGFLAIAPELYHRSGKHIQVEYGDKNTFMPLMGALSNEKMAQDLKATEKFLENLSNADKNNVFCIGFCMGGFGAVLASMELKLKGAISFYGAGQVRSREGMGLKPLVSQYNEINCPVQYFFGEDDSSIPSTDRSAIESALKENHKTYHFHVFNNSDHGFFCNERSVFNPQSAKLAWAETLSFIQKLKT